MVSDALPQQRIQPLPYGVYLFSVIALCLAGLAVCLTLAVSHYRIHTDIGYQSFCALTRAINCDTVSQSPWAVFGPMPLAAWGMVGYSLFLLLALFAASPAGRRRRIWTICLVLAVLYSAISLVLAALSTFLVKSYCIFCIVSYGINFLLVYFSWLIRRRFHAEPLGMALREDLGFLVERRRAFLPPLAAFGVMAAAACLSFPAYWKLVPPKASGAVSTGMTEEGHPWIGAQTPAVVITEFSDYQCFQCRKMHFTLRRLVAAHPDRIRLVHRNFPLDHEFNPVVAEAFHVGSGRMALIAIHAAAAGKFWEMNDRLFEKAALGESVDLPRLAVETGLDARELALSLEHRPYRLHLLRDIHQGVRHGISVTPSYLIEGKVHQGGIPAEVFTAFTGQNPGHAGVAGGAR